MYLCHIDSTVFLSRPSCVPQLSAVQAVSKQANCFLNKISVLGNNTHVILSRSDWLRLVSSSATGQWGRSVVCAALLRRYKAAMRDERRNSDPKKLKRRPACESAPLPCVCVSSRDVWTRRGSSEWGRSSSIVPVSTGSGRLRSRDAPHWRAGGEADSHLGSFRSRIQHLSVTQSIRGLQQTLWAFSCPGFLRCMHAERKLRLQHCHQL